MPFRSKVLLTALVCASLGSTSSFAEPPREVGLRGRLIVAPELLAATVWAVDARRASAMQTPANVRRPRGRPLLPMTEARPDLSVVVEGEDLRDEPTNQRPVVIEGMRFVPGQMLMARPGSLTVENKQGVDLTIVDGGGAELQKIPAGLSARVTLAAGVHELSTKELPYARASVKVLPQAKLLVFDKEGNLPLVDLASGEYTLSFYLGAAELRTQKLQVPPNTLLFIDATVSANTVVDVTTRDLSMQMGFPGGQ
jgi:hypothetical protein